MTVSAKTILNGTFSITRKTDLKGYIYYIEILGAKTFLLKATMASEIRATSETFDLKCAK